MAKPKKLIMAEMKLRRKAQGLKQVAFWLTEAEANSVKQFIEKMKK
jgi:hypothetical protein